MSNAPTGCPEISRETANYMRRQWSGSLYNSPNQSMRTGFTTTQGIKKWVTVSHSGGGSVVDFHAVWGTDVMKGFLWHFRVTEE